ncbi:MAG: hypothetical protein O3A55_00120 [Bacteroidetes bacterium]|nr:hypothetical protein [Bacteroidota bacterium]
MQKIIFVFLIFINFISAQDKIVPSHKSENEVAIEDTTMPKLENPEFVITKEEYLTPQLFERQLTDEEKIYSVQQKQFTNLPNTEQQKKSLYFLKREHEVMSGKVLFSFGNYSTPVLEGWFGKNYESSGILFHGLLYQSKGHTANAEKQKGNIELGGNISLLDFENNLQFLQKSRAQLRLGISTDNYGLYGSLDSTKKRSVTKFDLIGNLLQSEYSPSWLENPLSYQLQIGFNALSLSDYDKLDENKFSINLNSTTEINSVLYQLNTQYQSVLLNAGHQSYYFKTGLNIDYRLNSLTNTSMQFYQTYYRGSKENSNSQFGTNIKLTYQYSNPLQLSFNLVRDVKKLTIQDYLEVNPFVSTLSDLNQMAIPYQISLSGIYTFSDKLQFSSDFIFRSIENRPIFKSDSTKMFNVDYVDTKDLIISISLNYQNDFKHNLNITGKYNQQVDSDDLLPYVSVIELIGKYQIPIFENLNSSIDLIYATPRSFGFENNDGKSENIFKLSSSIDYKVLNNLTAILKIENLLNKRYNSWKGFSEPGIFISLGANYRW